MNNQQLQEVKALMLEISEETGKSVCHMLSTLVNDMLMSDDFDPCHVNGIEFMQTCDKAMMNNMELQNARC